MRTLLAAVGLVVAIFIGVALLSTGPDEPPSTTPPVTNAARPVVPAPQLTREQIDRQDRPSHRRQRAEARAFDRRPLLNALPITLQGVRFDIAGLASDDRTTVLTAQANGVGRRRVRIAYKTLLSRVGDRSDAYRLEIKP